MDDNRAAQIYVQQSDSSGSGYAIASNRILTALHVLGQAGRLPGSSEIVVEFRLWGDLAESDETWKCAHILCSDVEHDIALLNIDEAEISKSRILTGLKSQQKSTIVGRLPRSGEFECEAFGWPRVTRHDDKGRPMPFRGKTTGRGRTDQDLIRAISSDLTPKQEEGWRGISGAALHIQGTVVGVVVDADRGFAEGVLDVQPLYAISAEFWGHLSGCDRRDLREPAPLPTTPTAEQRAADSWRTVPPLPPNFVDREDMVAALRTALIDNQAGASMPLLAVSGMGGMGKTVLAQMLCRDAKVQETFCDGVVWITMGKESTKDDLTRLRQVGKALQEKLALCDDETDCLNQYRSVIGSKKVLIVLDDVWHDTDIDPFRADSSGSRLLFTTRDASIAAAVGAFEFAAGLMTEDESRKIFARWSGKEIAQFTPETEDLIQQCGRLPLALSMVAAMLRGKPLVLWTRTLDQLRNADLEKIKIRFPHYPHPTLFRALQVSVELLDAVMRERYFALAVLLVDMPLRPLIQQILWNVDEGEAAETAEKFIGLSLAQREADGVSIRLHGLQLDYIRSQYPDPSALRLIHGALRLSSHVIDDYPSQFTSQMVGRLLPYYQDQPAIAAFVGRLRETTPGVWLRLMTRTLTPPGASLLHILKAYRDADIENDLKGGVVKLAVSSSQIVSAGYGEGTLIVWDLERGAKLRPMAGHTGPITALAITSDDQTVISASEDKTVRIWSLKTGEAKRTIECHASALAPMPDNRRFLCALQDGPVTIREIIGDAVQTLTGCDSEVRMVTVTSDSRYVLACTKDKTLVWDLQSDLAPRTFSDGESIYKSKIAIFPGTHLAAWTREKTVRVWNVETGEAMPSIEREGFGFDQIAALPDGRSLIYACLTDVLEVMDVITRNIRLKLPNTVARVECLAVTPDGRRAVTGAGSGEIRIWDLESKPLTQPAQGHSRWIKAILITEDGRFATTISIDGSVMWDMDTTEVVHVFDLNWTLNPFRDSFLREIPGPWNKFEAVLPNGEVVAALNNNNLQIRKLYTNEILGPELVGHTGPISAVRASGDGSCVVSGSMDKTVRTWDVQQRKALFTFTGHTDGVSDVAVSEDGSRIVSAGSDHCVGSWDAKEGKLEWLRKEHSKQVVAVTIMPGSKYAVSASEDETLKVWDLATGKLLTSFTGQSAFMSCAASPDGVTVVAGDFAGAVHVLRLEGDETAPQARKPLSGVASPWEPAVWFTDMAQQFQTEGELQKAESYFSLAVQLRLLTLGLEHPLVAQSANYLGLFYLSQGQYDKAEPILKLGLTIFQKALGGQDPNVATNLYNLGSLWDLQSDWAKAEAFYKQSLEILEVVAADSEIMQTVLGSYADLLRKTGRESEAAPFAARAEALLKKQNQAAAGNS